MIYINPSWRYSKSKANGHAEAQGPTAPLKLHSAPPSFLHPVLATHSMVAFHLHNKVQSVQAVSVTVAVSVGVGRTMIMRYDNERPATTSTHEQTTIGTGGAGFRCDCTLVTPGGGRCTHGRWLPAVSGLTVTSWFE